MMIEDKLHRGIACHCKRCNCNNSDFCFNKCKCVDCTHSKDKAKAKKTTLLGLESKKEFETIENFIIRVIDYYLTNKVTSMPDISKAIRTNYGYSSSQISKAKKTHLKTLKYKCKILKPLRKDK